MNEVSPSPLARPVILLLGLAFLLMTGLVVKERLLHPQLTVRTQEQPAGQPMGGGDMATEVGQLMRQVADEPHNLALCLSLVERLTAAQNWEAAEVFAQRALAMEVDHPKALYLLGVIQHNLGRHAEAAATLERVVERQDGAAVRYGLGVLYRYFLQDTARAQTHWRAGLQDAQAETALRQAIQTELNKTASGGTPSPGTAQGTKENVPPNPSSKP